jgi:carbonic anhydrase
MPAPNDRSASELNNISGLGNQQNPIKILKKMKVHNKENIKTQHTGGGIIKLAGGAVSVLSKKVCSSGGDAKPRVKTANASTKQKKL